MALCVHVCMRVKLNNIQNSTSSDITSCCARLIISARLNVLSINHQTSAHRSPKNVGSWMRANGKRSIWGTGLLFPPNYGLRGYNLRNCFWEYTCNCLQFEGEICKMHTLVFNFLRDQFADIRSSKMAQNLMLFCAIFNKWHIFYQPCHTGFIVTSQSEPKNPFFVSRRTSCCRRRTTCSVREDKACTPSLSKSSNKACNQTGIHFHCYNLQKHLYVVIFVFLLASRPVPATAW